MIHGTGHSYEDYKVLKDYGNKYNNQTDSLCKKPLLTNV